MDAADFPGLAGALCAGAGIVVGLVWLVCAVIRRERARRLRP
jgi:hypothetical protein